MEQHGCKARKIFSSATMTDPSLLQARWGPTCLQTIFFYFIDLLVAVGDVSVECYNNIYCGGLHVTYVLLSF